MAKFDTAFNPYVSMITKPTGENEIQAVSSGMLDYLKTRDKNKLDEMEMGDLEAKRRDEKKLAQFGASGKTLGAFSREYGNFETAAGINAANKMRLDRAKQRLLEQKESRLASKPSTKTTTATAPSFNASAFSTDDDTQQTAKVSPAKTVTVYRNGKPVTYTVEG